MATSPRSKQDSMQTSMFLSEELPANPSALQDSEAVWQTNVATWRLNILGLLNDCGPDGWSGKTCPESCHRTEDGILVPFSGAWSNSGMGSHTEFLTLNTSEFHNAAAACSLSDILEIGDLPSRFFLSAKACAGILRRAETRRAELPPALVQALQATIVRQT